MSTDKHYTWWLAGANFAPYINVNFAVWRYRWAQQRFFTTTKGWGYVYEH